MAVVYLILALTSSTFFQRFGKTAERQRLASAGFTAIGVAQGSATT
jgi:hypothetical protein